MGETSTDEAVSRFDVRGSRRARDRVSRGRLLSPDERERFEEHLGVRDLSLAYLDQMRADHRRHTVGIGEENLGRQRSGCAIRVFEAGRRSDRLQVPRSRPGCPLRGSDGPNRRVGGERPRRAGSSGVHAPCRIVDCPLVRTEFWEVGLDGEVVESERLVAARRGRLVRRSRRGTTIRRCNSGGPARTRPAARDAAPHTTSRGTPPSRGSRRALASFCRVRRTPTPRRAPRRDRRDRGRAPAAGALACSGARPLSRACFRRRAPWMGPDQIVDDRAQGLAGQPVSRSGPPA